MTGIVAQTDGRRVLLTGDSASVGDKEVRLRATPKVFRAGPYAIGFTTSWRMGQILRYGVDLPAPERGLDDDALERFMVREFIEAIRAAFVQHGFARTARIALAPDFTVEGQAIGGAFLVGVDARIFEIQEDYQVLRPERSFAAIGAGAMAALGALHALEQLAVLSLEERARVALEAAETYSTAVRAPFHSVSTEE